MAAQNPYPALRKLVLTKPVAQLANVLQITGPVRGVVMDMAAPNGVATLVALSDCTASLYLSHGGGVLGLGKHGIVQQLVRELLNASEQYLPLAESTETDGLPASMRTRLHFITVEGTRVYEAAEEDLGMNRLPMSPFFHQMHKLMAVARAAMVQQHAK